jgi:4-aminobutyrate aminotransferase-like enzyme/Ser/Thr protein kinase RdoA (MazF antagonist)
MDELTHPRPVLTLDRLATFVRRSYGIEGTLTPLAGERDLNVAIVTEDRRLIGKVANAAESTDTIDLQTSALEHIARTDPTLPVPRVVPTLDGALSTAIEDDGFATRLWIVTALDGRPLEPGALPHATARDLGHMLARLQVALRGYFHPAAGRALTWDARRAAGLLPWTSSVPEPHLRRLVRQTLESTLDLRFRLSHLPAQVIHHDFSRGNLLEDPATGLCGVIDFGDMIHAARVQDVAVAAAYAMLGHRDPLEALVPVITGFLEHTPLEADELEVVPDLISTRLAQSLVISSHRARLHPDNTGYILIDTPAVSSTLDQWSRIEPRSVVAALRRVSGLPRSSPPDVAARRSRYLWRGLRLAYDEPLHLLDGDGVWLRDAAGDSYLDGYNNVPQVGHGNRRVIAAATAQAQRLNTNTRYLTDLPIELAEALVERLPDPLEVCLFVNSGSEATDLALRIARTVTGHTGSIVTTNAYHGWTETIYAMSPEERPADQAPDWVATIAPPGVPGRGPVDAIDELLARGRPPAAWWFDGTFSSDGIRVPGAGYLDTAAAAVRAHGGLVIADEVQGGLGRIGSDYWAFRVGTAVPDIVTLGKPLGNGYPIGAVVTSRDIADRFAGRAYFFSTFGGNPVSAAAALMVLRITDELTLPQRAERVGAYLRGGLPAALAGLDADVEVRGRGLFTGVDVGHGGLAHDLVEAMRRQGVLVGRTGPGGTVVKIRPPLVFDYEHADRLLEATADGVRAMSP